MTEILLNKSRNGMAMLLILLKDEAKVAKKVIEEFKNSGVDGKFF